MLTLRLIRREARVAWPVAVLLALLAVLLTAVSLSWPPRFDRMAAESLADRVARAQLSGPLVVAGTTTVPLSGLPEEAAGRGLDEELDRVGAGLRAAAAPRLAGVLGRPQGRVTTVTATLGGPGVPSPYGRPPRVSLAYAQPAGPTAPDGSDAPGGPAVEYVQGRAPQQPAAEQPVPPEEWAPIEVAVSEATRERMNLTVGRRFELQGVGWATPVVLVGVFRTERGPGWLWRQLPLLVEPLTAMEASGQELNGQLLTSSGGIRQAAGRGTVPLQLAWELPVAVDRSGPAATPAAVAGLRSALAGLRAADTNRLCGARSDELCLLAGHMVPALTVADRLTPELDAFGEQRRRTGQIQGFALVGLLAVVVATGVAAARLGARRRADAFALQLSRGAGLFGIAGRLLVESAVAVGAGAAVGWAVGLALTPPGAAPGSPVPALVAALLVWCAPAVVVLVPAGRPGSVPRSRRLVLEGVVVLLAAAGLVALRARGAFAGSGADLQLALTPVLLALVVVLVLVRLLPPVLRRAAGRARRSRGAVPLVALARAGRQSGAAALALLVLVLATGYGVFGGMVADALADSRAQSAAWRTGGAPAALVGPRDRLPGDLSQVRSVGQQVAVTGATGELTAQDDGTTFPGARLVGLDAAALRAADPSSPVARALLAADGAATPVTPAGPATPAVLTALADPALAARFPGGSFEVAALGMSRVLVRLVGVLPDEALRDPVLGPVLGTGPRPGALLLFTGPSARHLPAQNGQPSALLLYPAAGGPPLDVAAVRTAAAAQLVPTGGPGSRVELRDRWQESEGLRTDGLVRSVELAFRVTTGLGLLLALGAVVLDLLLGATERARTTSYLRTLGLGGRAVLGLHLLQLVPLLLAAAVGGTALGLLLPGALGPALRLGALTGGPFEPATHIDWTTTAALGVALAVLVPAAAAVEAAISRRRGLGAVLRLGEAL